MNWNRHWELAGKHALFTASSSYWVNYDTDKLISVYNNLKAKERGTRLHTFACDAIKLGIKLSHSKKSLNRYVNDAIGFCMEPELILYYSQNFFGTADSISFRDGVLRIHDLKTGKHPASFRQLEVYAALFCLEYNVNPDDIDIFLRIYQNDEVFEECPESSVVFDIMDTIVEFDKIIDGLQREEG